MSDIYLSLTETPTVVTLSQPVVSGALAGSVTVTNVVSVNVVTMPAITVQAAAPAVTTVAGTVAVSNFPASSSVTIANFPATQVVSVSNFPASSSVTIANFPSVTTVTGTVALDPASLIALENVTVTVGAAVTISNFPSTQTIAGTVTAKIQTINKNGVISFGYLPVDNSAWSGNSGAVVVMGGADDGAVPVQLTSIANLETSSVTFNANVAGTVTANGGDFSTLDGEPTPPSGAVQIGWWNGTDEYFHVRPNSPLPIGIVGRYGPDGQISNGQLLGVQKTSNYYGTSWDRYVLEVANVNSVTIGNSITIGSLPAISGTVTARLQDGSGNNLTSTSIGGVQRLNVSLASAATPGGTLPSFINVHGGTDGSVARTMLLDSSGRTVVTVSNFPATQAVSLASTTVTVSSLPNVTIGNSSVTVSQSAAITVGALPSGALTTRFGSVTTANLSQITTAVTNTSRKYLLAQNISTGSVTIGIGFSPTTTQGIQLTAGAGLTFDAFCPTGAVYWLGAVTGAAFTILEG